jgi:hypothetical protein
LEIVEQGNLNAISAESNLYDRIVLAQLNDEGVQLIKQKLAGEDPKYSCFHKDAKDVVWFEQRLVVPIDPELRKEIFDEAHLSKFSIHPGSTKMYQDLRKNFWWSNMKVDIAKYVAECDTCHRVKANYLKSAGVLQPLTIPLWKWDDISMDFHSGFTPDCQKEGFYLGYSGLIDQDCSFHRSAHHLLRPRLCRTLYRSNCVPAQDSQDHCF